MHKIRYASSFKERLRVRFLDEDYVASRASEKSLRSGSWTFLVDHGGGVCNSYGYKAETECVLAVSDPNGLVVVWCARRTANKITKRGAAEACVPNSGNIWDGRVKDPGLKVGARNLLKSLHAKVWGPLEKLADCAS